MRYSNYFHIEKRGKEIQMIALSTTSLSWRPFHEIMIK